jgi:hypothetical protein
MIMLPIGWLHGMAMLARGQYGHMLIIWIVIWFAGGNGIANE